MNNGTLSNTSDAFGGVSKKFLSRLIALILEKISYRTLTVDNENLRITGPKNVVIQNNLSIPRPGIFVDASDNVGIGMSTPGYNLHVGGDMKVDGDFYIAGTTYTLDTGMQVTDALEVINDGTATAIRVGQNGSRPMMEFVTNGLTNGVLDYSGALGIGTTRPLDRIDVRGFMRASNGYKVGPVVLFDASGNATFPGTLDVSDNLAINGDRFEVAASSGNTHIAGTLNVDHDLAIGLDRFYVDADTGDTTVMGILTVGDAKFVVYPDTGAIDASGSLTINGDRFTVDAATGDTYVDGDLDISQNFRVNTNRFVVEPTGHTSIFGALDVSNNVTIGRNHLSKVQIDAYTGSVYTSGNVDVSSNINVSQDATVMGNLYVNGYTTVVGAFNIDGVFSMGNAITINPNGNISITGNLDVSKNFAINAGPSQDPTFGVQAMTGNTSIRGTLDVSQNVTMGASASVAVDASVGRDLTVGRRITVDNITDVITLDHGIQTVAVTYGMDLSGSLAVGDENFLVDALSGDVFMMGDLDVSGNTRITGNTTVEGSTDVTGDAFVGGTLYVADNTFLDADLQLGGGAYVFGGVAVQSDLLVAETGLSVVASTGQVGVGTSTPAQPFTFDVSGQAQLGSLVVRDRIGTHGYLVSMPAAGQDDPSFRFTRYTTDEAVYQYDVSLQEITLTQEGSALGNSIVEFNLADYIQDAPVNELELSFEAVLVATTADIGSGLGMSFFHALPYTDTWLPYADLGGFTLLIDFFGQSFKFYQGEELLDEQTVYNPQALIDGLYHAYKLQVIRTPSGFDVKLLVDDELWYGYLCEPTTNDLMGRYTAIAGWTSSTETLTQRVRGLKVFARYDNVDNVQHKLQVMGDAYLKSTTIDGNLTCVGNFSLNGRLQTTGGTLDVQSKLHLLDDLQVDGGMVGTGDIVRMPGPGERGSGFRFATYLIGDDFAYDNINGIITLTQSGVGSTQSVVEFNLSDYIGQSALHTARVEFDFTMFSPVAGGGLGMWVFFYNATPHGNMYNGYQKANGGYALFLDVLNDDILMFDDGAPVYVDTEIDLSAIKDVTEVYHHLQLDASFTDTVLQVRLTIDGAVYWATSQPLTRPVDGNYFGVGAVTGGGALTQKVANLRIGGRFADQDRKLAVFGDTLLRGQVDVIGPMIGYDADLHGSVVVDNKLTVNTDLLVADDGARRVGVKTQLPQYDLDVHGDIHFTGDLFQNGVLFNTTTQWELVGDTGYTTDRAIGIGVAAPGFPLDVSGNIRSSEGLYVKNNRVLDGGGNIVSASFIPPLNATKIVSGVFDPLRIPFLDASKIRTGVFAPELIPNLDAGKIASGTLSGARIPNGVGNGTIVVTTGASGRVAVGAPLDVSGNLTFTGSLLQGTTPVGTWAQHPDGSFYVLGRDVGIGTSEPEHPLHVAGTMHADAYHNLPVYGGRAAVPSAATSPVAVTVPNPYGTDAVTVTGNCRSRFQNVKQASQILVEIGDVTASEIEFLVSKPDGSGWASTENVLHYMVYKN
jgi:predicted acyltransferase (DUF342 family)